MLPVSEHAFDATQANFEQDVLQASLTTPVLVDFWAPWCAPCKTLGPILEKIVAGYAGTLKLARVDADVEMQLAGAFGIRSLPTVVLVKDGQVVDGFMGALPESAIREFLQRHLPGDAAAEVLPAQAEPPGDAAAVAQSAEQEVAHLQQAIATAPDKPELKLELALALMRAGLADAAQTELDALPANLAEDAKAKRLRHQIDFAHTLRDAPSENELRARISANAEDFAARDMLGVRLALGDAPATGLDEFLYILKVKRDFNEGQAKKRLIAAFNVLEDEELVSSYRRKMASLLF